MRCACLVASLCLAASSLAACGHEARTIPDPACNRGETRCVDKLTQVCLEGTWTEGDDCAAVGRSCSQEPMGAACLCPAGSIDDGPTTCLPLGDGRSCAAPALLTLESAKVYGTTLGAGNDTTSKCGGDGEDLVYALHLTKPRHLLVQASGFSAILSIRNSCADAASELSCDSAESHPGTSAVLDASLEAGTYYLLIDGRTASRGAFTLRLDTQCGPGMTLARASGDCVADPCSPDPCTTAHTRTCTPILPVNYGCTCEPGFGFDYSPGFDTCALDPALDGSSCDAARPLDAAPSPILGSTVGHADSGTGSCGQLGGPDVVYSFAVDAPTRADFTLAGFDAVLHLRRDCALAATQVGCNDDGGPGVKPGAHLRATLTPGQYFLFADSFAAPGAYTLDYALRTDPCAGDPCPGAPTCRAALDWTSYACVCAPGLIAFAGTCIIDPCGSRPCGETHKGVCTAAPPAAYSCGCDAGYMQTASACALDPAAAAWTFMVYMNGDNTLESAAYNDLDEMMLVGSSSRVKVVVLLDTLSRDGGRARRLLVNQGGVTVLDELGEVDMGDWRTLADFGAWAVQKYPAEHYALVLWDHGDGWRSTSGPAGYRTFSTDDTNGTFISVAQGGLAAALAGITAKSGARLDVVGFDACLMATWEVAEVASPYAHLLIGSEDLEPAGGWLYDLVLNALVQTPEQSAEQLAAAIIDPYLAASGQNSTMSATRVDDLASLEGALNTLATLLRARPSDWAAVEAARLGAQMINNSDELRDVRGFAERLAADPLVASDVRNAAGALATQLAALTVRAGAQPALAGALGLSIYFPGRGTGTYDVDYNASGAVWSVRTTWDEFLKDFVK